DTLGLGVVFDGRCDVDQLPQWPVDDTIRLFVSIAVSDVVAEHLLITSDTEYPVALDQPGQDGVVECEEVTFQVRRLVLLTSGRCHRPKNPWIELEDVVALRHHVLGMAANPPR